MTTQDTGDTPYDLFLCYAEADHAWAEGYLLPALELPPERVISRRQIGLGASLAAEFERAVVQSRYTLLVLSPAFLADEWAQFGEQLTSFANVVQNRRRLIPLRLVPCKLPLRLSFLNPLEWGEEEQWGEAAARLRELLLLPPPQEQQIPCPYPGMVTYEAADARFFHGREDEINKMVQHLHHSRLLFVIGPSGAGKSSLLEAGLLPRLQSGNPFPRGHWLVRHLRPDDRPTRALAQIVRGELRPGTRTPAELLGRHWPAQRLLIVIDPFEALFTQAKPEEQRRFIAALRLLLRDERVALLCAMRADFYGDLMGTALWPLGPGQRMEITPLRGPALRAAIEGPAEQCGVLIEPALVVRLLDDAADEPGVLPLLQETMVQLWQQRAYRLLPLSAYERMADGARSGLAVAVETAANAALAELAPAQQEIARRIMLRLVLFGEGRANTRRQQPVAALHSDGDDPAEVEAVLAHLARRRLLTLSDRERDDRERDDRERGDRERGDRERGDRERGDRVADLAHDSLLVGWSALRDWVERNEREELVRRRLEDKVDEWKRMGRGRGGLLDATELEETEGWLESAAGRALGASADLRALVETSRLEINPGWNARGVAGMGVGVLSIAGIVGLLILFLLIIVFNENLLWAIVFMVSVIVAFLCFIWLHSRRSDHYVFQKISHSPIFTKAIYIRCFALSVIALWSVFLLWWIPISRSCENNLLLNSQDINNIVAITNEDVEKSQVDMLIELMNQYFTNEKTYARILDWNNAQYCRRYFRYHLSMSKSDSESGETFYSVVVEDTLERSRNKTITTPTNGSCSSLNLVAIRLVDYLYDNHKDLPFIDIDDAANILPGPRSCIPYIAHEEGLQFLLKGDYDSAEESFINAIDMFPEYSLAYANLAVVYIGKSQYKDAILQLKKAISLSPKKYAPFLAQLATACYRAKDFKCAKKYNLEAIIHDKKRAISFEVYNNLSIMYRDWASYDYSCNETSSVCKKYTLSIENLNKAEKFTKGNYDMEYIVKKNRGILAFRQEDFYKSIYHLSGLSNEGNGFQEEILYYLSLSYEYIKKRGDACNSWFKYLQIHNSSKSFGYNERSINALRSIDRLNCK